MKFLEKIAHNLKPKFEEGGKLHKYLSVYDTLETFLFTPDHTTKSGSHIRDGIDLKRTMMIVIIAMIPALLFGMWNIGHFHYLSTGESAELMDKFFFGLWKVLPMIAVSYGVGLGVEFLFAFKAKHGLHEGYLVSGMLIPLTMPPEIPLWMLAIAVVFAVLVGKEVFGGTGMNILNVALLARAFIFFAYPTKIAGEIWISEPGTVDGYSGATAMGELATTVGKAIESPMVQKVMTQFEGGMYSMSNAFYGTIPGSVGETSALAILMGAAILLFTGIGSWRVMLSFLGGGLAMGAIFNLADANAFMTVTPLHQILLGGFMFGMVFMATDPVTSAQTNTGKWIYGFFGGFFGIMFRVFNPAYPEGIMLAILFMNIMAPMIDHYVIQSNVKKRLKRLKTA